MSAKTFSQEFLEEASRVIEKLDSDAIERIVSLLAQTRLVGGRLFILGVGGSAANASHAVNDFRKIAGIEAYAPTDNVSELTARTNDEGWATVFEGWLRTSRLSSSDLILVLSVGGGNLEKNVSPNLVAAINYAKKIGARIAGIVGRDGGYTAKMADECVIIPTVNPNHVTPHSEAFQSIVWHLLVSHPQLKVEETKWESTTSAAPASRPAVFLDRDGVINRAFVRDGKPFPPSTLEELEILPDVADALNQLKRHGFELVVVSNQPDVARGTQSKDNVERINRAIGYSLPISDFFTCYHTDEDNCSCRKPRPGLLLLAAQKHNLDLSKSYMVGDRWRDVEAGQSAGCKTILIDRSYREKAPARSPDTIVTSMGDAAQWIINSSMKGT